MDGFVPILFLMVVLKIPVGLMLYIVWWAFRAETAPEQAPPESGDHRFRRFDRVPKRPRGPRRGSHGPDAVPLPECPPAGRTRVGAAGQAAGASWARRSATTSSGSRVTCRQV